MSNNATGDVCESVVTSLLSALKNNDFVKITILMTQGLIETRDILHTLDVLRITDTEYPSVLLLLGYPLTSPVDVVIIKQVNVSFLLNSNAKLFIQPSVNYDIERILRALIYTEIVDACVIEDLIDNYDLRYDLNIVSLLLIVKKYEVILSNLGMLTNRSIPEIIKMEQVKPGLAPYFKSQLTVWQCIKYSFIRTFGV